MFRFPPAWIILPLLTVNALAQDGRLYHAAETGDLEQVRSLVEQGVDIDGRAENAETPLLAASFQGHSAVVEWLLAHDADIHARNEGGFTALHAAAHGGHEAIASLLIAKGAAVDDRENRYRMAPLHIAAEKNQAAVAALLLSHGADANIKEINGINPLSRAVWRQHTGVVRLLKRYGATCQRMLGKRWYQKCVRMDQ